VARVVGNDATIAFGQTGSFLELNVMLPVTRDRAARVDRAPGRRGGQLQRALHRGLDRHRSRPQLVEQGLMLATALAPVIGYDEAAKLAKERPKSGRTIRELALERGWIPRSSIACSTRRP
jgi:fumarate hydratase class II